jgi:hypothetical protein
MVIEGHFKTTTLEDIGGRLTGAGFMATVKECGMCCLECAILGSVLRSPTHDVNMVAVMQCPIKCHSTQLMMPELSEDAKRMIDSILENEYAAIAIKKAHL